MAIQSLRVEAASTIAFAFLLGINFLLHGCSNESEKEALAFVGSGACESWCHGDQTKVENGETHKDWHCGRGSVDMTDKCGGCDYCGSSGNTCCSQCSDSPFCSPQSGNCYSQKSKDYYLSCGGGGDNDPVPAPSPSDGNSNTCLCVFDIDRTLTAKQGQSGNCPGTKETSYWDKGYDGGKAVLSRLSAEGIRTTFCNDCYLGITSAGGGSGADSAWNNYLLDTVMSGDVHDGFKKEHADQRKWSYGTDVHSPYVLYQKNGYKQDSVEKIRQWYGDRGVQISAGEVYFFGDHTGNLMPFAKKNLNSRQVSCDSRDESHGNGIGKCGATPSEITRTQGNHVCR